MELVDRDKEQKKTASWLYYFGKMKSPEDLHAIIANLKAVFSPLVDGFLESDFWKQVEAIDRRLAKADGQRWLGHHTVGNPTLIHHLVDKLQSILSKYVELSNQQEYRDAVRHSTPLESRCFTLAKVYTTVIAQQIDQSISGHDIKQWSGIPRWVPMLRVDPGEAEVEDSPRPAKLPKHNPSTAPPNNSTSTASRTDILTAEQITFRKSKGFLAWEGTGLPKACTVMWAPIGGGNEQRLCIFFASKGLFCKSKNCQNFHTAGYNQVPAAKQQAFKNYVKNTKGLSFAPGNEPPST